MFYVNKTQGPHELLKNVTLLTVKGSRTNMAYSFNPVYHFSFFVLGQKILIPRLLNQLGYSVKRPIPSDLLPSRRIGSPIKRVKLTIRVVDQLIKGRPFRTEASFTYGMIGISFGVDHFPVFRINDDPHTPLNNRDKS